MMWLIGQELSQERVQAPRVFPSAAGWLTLSAYEGFSTPVPYGDDQARERRRR